MSESFNREMGLELDRSFPLWMSFTGMSSWVTWLQAIVEECLGNIETAEAYLKALGFDVANVPMLKAVLDWLVQHYKGARDVEVPSVDTNGKTCASAFAASDDSQGIRVGAFMAANKHPLINKIIENRCLAAYKKAHPNMGAIDWQAIIAWVIANGPAIMQFILMLVSLFGG